MSLNSVLVVKILSLRLQGQGRALGECINAAAAARKTSIEKVEARSLLLSIRRHVKIFLGFCLAPE